MLDDVGDGQAAAFLDAVRDRRCGEHDGQVGFDGLAGAVEYGPGCKVGLGHAERAFDLPQVVVAGDHFASGHGGGVAVGDVALQPDQ